MPGSSMEDNAAAGMIASMPEREAVASRSERLTASGALSKSD